MADAFPLDWPVGFPRTQHRRRSQFEKRSFARARDELMGEIRRLNAQRVVLSTNIPLRRDGLPYAGACRIQDPGVAVYFTWKSSQKVIACDRWETVEENMRAVELTIAAMRGLERWGASDMLNRVFSGFTALPPPPKEPTWAEVLGVPAHYPLDLIEAAYRHLMMQAHPDVGGSAARATELNRAITQARQEKRP